MKYIIINATATKYSGALTILLDCINYLEIHKNNNIEYHLFTVVNEFDTKKNIIIHKIPIQNWLSRLKWDNSGLQKWCEKNNLEPNMIISFQNTSTKYKNSKKKMIEQIVYYHQPIPLYTWKNYSINIIFYYYFYPFFVNRNNLLTHYVVQLPYIKEQFCKKYKNIKSNRVSVIRPNKPNIDITTISEKIFEGKKVFRFLYPAVSLDYKNHAVLISALIKLKNEDPNIINEIALIFTINNLPKSLMYKIKTNKLDSCIYFVGHMHYSELLSYYKSVDALLFPSKVESFGLPLIEAEYFGLPIIASDLPYAKEVLENYENKYFCNPDDVTTWVKEIKNYKIYKKYIYNNKKMYDNTWKIFFDLAEGYI